jgi:hypothetical protein
MTHTTVKVITVRLKVGKDYRIEGTIGRKEEMMKGRKEGKKGREKRIVGRKGCRKEGL